MTLLIMVFRREVARRQREDEELRRREELNLIEARRNDRISDIEKTWARLQEEQRQQDDALIAFISVARERRAYEREQVFHSLLHRIHFQGKRSDMTGWHLYERGDLISRFEQEALELAAEAAERERKARFDELELLREKRIRAKEQKSKASAEMQAAEVMWAICVIRYISAIWLMLDSGRQPANIRACEPCSSAALISYLLTVCEEHHQEEIVRHRLAELDRVRRINERRCAAVICRQMDRQISRQTR